MRTDQPLAIKNPSSHYQGLGSEGFIRTSLEQFWRQKDPMKKIFNDYSLKEPFTTGTFVILGAIGFLLGIALKSAYDLPDFLVIIATVVGILLAIPVNRIQHRRWDKKSQEADENEKQKFVNEKISKYDNGNDFDRAEMILEWIEDESHGLLAHLTRQTESARGDSSGYARNEKNKYQSAISDLIRLREKAIADNRTNQLLEIEAMLEKAKIRYDDIDNSPEVKILQAKLAQAEDKLLAVKNIEETLKNEVPFDRDMERYRQLLGEDDSYQSINPKTVAHQSLRSAMEKLEEVISTSENLEDDVTLQLPDVKFAPALKASRVQKVLNEA